MAHVEPTNPFHIARAYATRGADAARPVVRPMGAPADAGAPQRVEKTRSLVAAVVPGRVDFTTDVPAPGAGALPLYRHPADKNAAATLVQIGRAVDVTG